MGNEVTTTGSGALAHLNTQAMQNAFADAGAEFGGDGNFGKFNGNTGDYTYGVDGEEIEHGTEVMVNMMTAFNGWICWIDSKPDDRVIVKVIDGKPPRESELEDHGPYAEDGDGWGPSCGFTIALETGEEIEMVFNSAGGQRAFGKLMKDFAKGMTKFPGMMPIIELGASSFENKKSRGKKYAPVFTVVDWATPEEFAGGGEYEAEETVKKVEKEPTKPKAADKPKATNKGDGGIPVREGRRAATSTKATVAAKEEAEEPEVEEEADAPDEAPAEEAAPRRRRRNI